MPRPLLFLLIALAAALLSWAGTAVMRRVALRFNIADHPNERRINTRSVPRAGGLSVALTFAVVAAYAVAQGPGGAGGDTGGDVPPPPMTPCQLAVDNTLKCHISTYGFYSEPTKAVMQSSPCCASDILGACGDAGTFLSLWQNATLFDPWMTRVIQEYTKNCPAAGQSLA